MNFNNVKVPKVPGGGAASALFKLGFVAGLGVYGVANSLYNVEGGHRAIVFNRIIGIKDKVGRDVMLDVISLLYIHFWVAVVSIKPYPPRLDVH